MTGRFPKRGDVYWVLLDPSIGHETRKTRPCLVVSNDKGNEHSHTVLIAPITSKTKKLYSFEAKVSISGKDGKIMLDQCRAVDKSRLGKMECHVDNGVMADVDEAIRIVFGL